MSLWVTVRLRVGGQGWGQGHRRVCISCAALSFHTKVPFLVGNPLELLLGSGFLWRKLELPMWCRVLMEIKLLGF